MSVLIVNYNGRRHLQECLRAVFDQTYSNLEVILVDNASADDSLEFVSGAFPGVKLVRSEKNLGFAGGNNLGRRYCGGEWVYFLNNDTRMDPRAIEILMDSRTTNSEYHVFASLLLAYSDPSKVDSAGDTFYWAGLTFSFTGYPTALFHSPRSITSACAAAVLYPRMLLEKLDWFDEDFFLNFEDIDLSLRARHAGSRILLVPQSKVYHKGSATLGGKKSATSFYYGERNFQWVILKNFPLPILLRFLPGFVFVKVARMYSAWRAGCLKAYLRGNLDSLRFIPRMLQKRGGILTASTISTSEFGSLFRRRWMIERLKFMRGNYDIPL